MLSGSPTTYTVQTLADAPNAGAGVTDGQISLREALQAINTGRAFGDAPAPGPGIDVVKFESRLTGGTLDLSTAPLPISSDVRIFGGGVAIDGNDRTRLFNVAGATAILGGLRLLDGRATSGGAIAVTDGELVLGNSTLVSNTAASGGAVYAINSTVRGSGVTFDANTATVSGGAIAAVGSDVIFTASGFHGNAAGNGSGGSVVGGGALSTVSFNGRTSRVALSEIDFADNIARGAGTGGGAINLGAGNTLRVTNSRFTGNATDVGVFDGVGGAVQLNVGSRSFIAGSTFTGNEAAQGGAIHNQGRLRLVGSTIAGNAAANNGGGLRVGGTATSPAVLQLVDSTVQDNGADNGAGIAIENGIALIADSVIGGAGTAEANKARFDGGGLFIGGELSRVFVRGTFIGANEARFSGGGIDVRSGSGLLRVEQGSVVEANRAQAGGGVAVRPLSGDSGSRFTFVLDESRVQRNVASKEGGGINLRADDTAGVLRSLVLNSSVVGNTAGRLVVGNRLEGGGGIRVGGVLEVVGSAIENNTATAPGGGLYVAADSRLLVSSSRITGNRAIVDVNAPVGGGIGVRGSAQISANAVISGNVRIVAGAVSADNVALLH